ncbi:MAG: peptidylprolyl isomerase [Solirubrobacteraceae bacterium]
MRRANVLIVVALAALVLAACGKDSPTSADAPVASQPAQTETTEVPAVPPRSANDGCKAVATPEPKADPDATRSRRRLDPKRRNVAVVKTNCASFRILLDVKRAPKTTASFAGLIRRRYFDGLTFHRIAKPGGNDFVIQGGDPTGTGNGGPGYSIVEAPPKSTTYDRGVVAMAKAADEQPGTSGSQFFIVTADETQLPPEYALLGRILGDTTALRRIAALAADPVTDMPVDPVVIESIRLTQRKR